MTGADRRVLLLAHSSRTDLQEHTREVAHMLARAGIQVAVPPDQVAHYADLGAAIVPAEGDHPARGCELVFVLGGDGTILRGAELSRGCGVPLLGVNFGHVGFLAEADRADLPGTVERVVAADYLVEDRMTLDVVARLGDRDLARSWALNEVTVEKAARERMIELNLEIEGRPLSTWGCDGLIVATPTGSTAYAFSAGGPVMWPDVQALLIVPISAHALFARPVVVGKDSHVAVELVPGAQGRGVMWCDGARPVELPDGARVEVVRSQIPVRLVRLTTEPFTDRIVEKFHLPVEGWRGAAHRRMLG
ncbi:MAG: NAD kinase [Austwickia sp.]|nr:NAD kinase [Austwickia sp.]MBK9100756.1 NAD kinase [Austwickia sp.]